MTDWRLLDEINTLIIAGHETSAGTLNWAWYLLSRHPDVEARLLAEIDAFTGDKFGFRRVDGPRLHGLRAEETNICIHRSGYFSRRAIADDRLGELPSRRVLICLSRPTLL
ncbi:MAG: cytochrome P450 [Gammaproteobacteria bacterium]